MQSEMAIDTRPNVNTIYGHREIQNILKAAGNQNLSALLIGDTGTGKTTIVKHIATRQKKEWIRFNLTGETTVDDFVGKWTLQNGETVWQDGVLLQAMRQGKWLVVDEINVALPEILFVLHSLLDDDKYVVLASKDGEMVRPHKDFRFFATMNPVDEYAGTKELNKAFKSRFDIIAYMDYPPTSTETRVLTEKTGIEKDLAKRMVIVGQALRKAKKDDKIFYTCSTRDLMQWARLHSIIEDVGESFRYSILNKANGDGKEVEKIYNGIESTLKEIETSYETLEIEELEKVVNVIREERRNLENERARFKREITSEVYEELRNKLGSLTDVVPENEVLDRVEGKTKEIVDKASEASEVGF